MGSVNSYTNSLITTWPKTAAFDPSMQPHPFDAMEIVSRDGNSNPTRIDYFQFNPFYTGSLNFTGSYATFESTPEFIPVMTTYIGYDVNGLVATSYTVKLVGNVLNDSATM